MKKKKPRLRRSIYKVQDIVLYDVYTRIYSFFIFYFPRINSEKKIISKIAQSCFTLGLFQTTKIIKRNVFVLCKACF